MRGLTVNFRSQTGDPRRRQRRVRRRCSATGFTPLVAGRAPEELRLFAPDPPEEPRVELLACETAGWEEREAELGPRRRSRRSPGAAPRRARSRRGCARRSTRGRPQRDVVVLVRATSSLRLYEQALEEQGLPHLRRRRPRLLGAGAGPRRHRLPRAAGQPARRGGALRRARRRRSAARAPTRWCCSPRRAAREGDGAWAALRRAAAAPPGAPWLAGAAPPDAGRRGCVAFARFAAGERLRAERLPVEVLLERAIAATGYDLAILARAGGDRRLANLRKLMRLAREYERAEGRDLRGFLAYAVGQDLAEAREGEAALESEGLDAVRLMTIHRAKGLEFPVVCVADLGRAGRDRARAAADRRRRQRRAASSRRSPAASPCRRSATTRIADALAAAEAAEERRLLYVAATRAEERLILSGGVDTAKWPAPRAAAARRSTGSRRRCSATPARGRRRDGAAVVRCGDGAVAVRLVTAGDAAAARPPRPRRASARAGARHRAARRAEGDPGRRPPAARAAPALVLVAAGLRPLRLPLLPHARARPAARRAAAAARRERGADAPRRAARRSRARIRGSLVHLLLERLDFARPEPPDAPSRCARSARAHGLELEPAQVEDIRAQVAAFAASPLCARLAAARGVRREAGFAFALEPGGGGPLVTGFVDVLAREPDGTRADRRLQDRPARRGRGRPAALVERAYATQRMVYALAALQRRRAARRGRLLPARAARASRSSRDVHAGRRARARRRAARARRRACSPSAGRSPTQPAPRAVRRLPRPARRCAPGRRR